MSKVTPSKAPARIMQNQVSSELKQQTASEV